MARPARKTTRRRPTRLTVADIGPETLIRIEGWARDGLTNPQIATNLGIAERTLERWMQRSEAIETALKRGKDIADREVENALHRTAIGFDYEEEFATPRGQIVKVRKHALPNTTAQIFWLKNRKPAEWRDRRETAAVDAPPASDVALIAALDKAAADAWKPDEEPGNAGQ